MKSRIFVRACALILVALAPATMAAQGSQAKAQYTITDLGTLPGGNLSQATFVTNKGLISGISTTADGTQHAVAWYGGSIFDFGTPLGGPNSLAVGASETGIISGQAETSKGDPNNENFCAYFTGLQCRPFAWYKGVIHNLPMLGGNNGTVAPPNRHGLIPGVAETNVADPSCPTTPAVNGTGPQILKFEPVLWNLEERGAPHRLPLPNGDTVGLALWVNNNGIAVGTTGTCANTLVPPFVIGAHAVIWDKLGRPHDLGNLGGQPNPNLLGVGNVAFAINDKVQVTGVSVLPDGINTHAFLWSSGTMRDLGALPGDNMSAGLGMNNFGDVAGSSIAGPDPLTGVPKAVVWHNGRITDLNTVVPADTSLFLLTAFMINDVGQVAGFGVDLNTSEVHAFLATPQLTSGAPDARGAVELRSLPSHVQKQLRRGPYY
jgi:probable HAF family extracellular repeat protein